MLVLTQDNTGTITGSKTALQEAKHGTKNRSEEAVLLSAQTHLDHNHLRNYRVCGNVLLRPLLSEGHLYRICNHVCAERESEPGELLIYKCK